VSVSCLGRRYVSGLLHQYSVGRDAVFDVVKNCKPHVKNQIMLKSADRYCGTCYAYAKLFTGERAE
jgi:hypothetical protein